MSSIFPFPGWRFDPGKVDLSQVVSPPYDVIDPGEQTALYARDPHNVVRLILGLNQPDDSPRHNRYTRAAAHLDIWRSDNLFLQDRPAVYLYEQRFTSGGATTSRLGFLARVRLSEWGREGVYPHEKTLSGPKADRLELIRATRGNLEPIFGLLADPEGEVENTLANLVDYRPFLDFSLDGVENRMWVVDDDERLHRLLSLMPEPRLFIADGHHRYETSLAYQLEVREKMRQAGQIPPLRGDLDCDYILMYIVPDSDPGLVIWPTHRLLHSLPDFSAQNFLQAASRSFTVSPTSRESLLQDLPADGLPLFGFSDGKDYWILRLNSQQSMEERYPEAPEAWRVLDVAVLHSLLLEEILGIDEGKLLRRENVNYRRDASATLEEVERGQDGAQGAFILRATPMHQVRDISEAGAVMPQKSTYFYPKPLSGTIFHLFW
ncbi:MAG: DUF1015 domain-containing protein [Planctomycetota bacterium]|jgi:uncharacterized protein (DUF1015 family)|nr:DUF1015 domain-containing protein [Planctomycetota bacterium]